MRLQGTLRALQENHRVHLRQLVDGSGPAYFDQSHDIPSPTCASWWMLQVQPNLQRVNRGWT